MWSPPWESLDQPCGPLGLQLPEFTLQGMERMQKSIWAVHIKNEWFRLEESAHVFQFCFYFDVDVRVLELEAQVRFQSHIFHFNSSCKLRQGLWKPTWRVCDASDHLNRLDPVSQFFYFNISIASALRRILPLHRSASTPLTTVLFPYERNSCFVCNVHISVP